ncbi:hypothetical protein EQ500_11775 [Lactobacillus sp. XV13L]|nr:hypothetical protein [Lactobacillus sp. XV13L]
MVGKIRLTTRQWGHIFLISGGSFFLLTIIEAGIFYLWMSQPLQGAVGLVLIFLDLIISLILGYQRYFQDELMLVLAQFRNLSPTHARDLEQLQVHNLYLQEVVKQLLLITKTMHTAIKQQQESELSKDELITNVSHD